MILLQRYNAHGIIIKQDNLLCAIFCEVAA